MKNKLLLVIISAMIILPNFSFAQTRTQAETKAKVEAKEETKANASSTPKRLGQSKEVIKNEIVRQKEAIKNSIQQRVQTAIGKMINKVSEFTLKVIGRYEAATERLDKLAGRIDSRISKIEAAKIDVSEAKKLMVTAKAKIEVARVSVADIGSTTKNTTFGSTTAAVKQNFASIKTQIEKAKNDLKDAHAALIDVVTSLKPGDNKLKVSASSSATSTATSTATTTRNKVKN